MDNGKSFSESIWNPLAISSSVNKVVTTNLVFVCDRFCKFTVFHLTLHLSKKAQKSPFV